MVGGLTEILAAAAFLGITCVNEYCQNLHMAWLDNGIHPSGPLNFLKLYLSTFLSQVWLNRQLLNPRVTGY